MFVRLAVLSLLIALVVGLAARPSGSAGRPVSYVVKPTDTLWSIAARSYAGDLREGVWKLEQRNQLASATIRPGQTLVLPG
jgi:LysM repeat protein